MSEWRLVIADVLVVAGTLGLTVAVFGIVRIPDVFAKIHASSKAVVLGVFVVLSANLATCGLEGSLRALLIAVFLFFTFAVGAHALARLEVLLRGPRR